MAWAAFGVNSLLLRDVMCVRSVLISARLARVKLQRSQKLTSHTHETLCQFLLQQRRAPVVLGQRSAASRTQCSLRRMRTGGRDPMEYPRNSDYSLSVSYVLEFTLHTSSRKNCLQLNKGHCQQLHKLSGTETATRKATARTNC